MTETLAEPRFATYARAPSSSTATVRGSTPTEISVTAFAWARSTHDRVFESGLTTSSLAPSAVIAMAELARLITGAVLAGSAAAWPPVKAQLLKM